MPFCKECHKEVVKEVLTTDDVRNVCSFTGFEITKLTSSQMKNIAGCQGRGALKRLKNF